MDQRLVCSQIPIALLQAVALSVQQEIYERNLLRWKRTKIFCAVKLILCSIILTIVLKTWKITTRLPKVSLFARLKIVSFLKFVDSFVINAKSYLSRSKFIHDNLSVSSGKVIIHCWYFLEKFTVLIV